MDETGIIKEDVHKMTRENFKEWFRKINMNVFDLGEMMIMRITPTQT